MTRKITPSLAAIVEELELEKARLVTRQHLGKLRAKNDTKPALPHLVRDLKAQGWIASTGVRGVYDGDPQLDPSASFLPRLTHLEAIERGLKVMDTTALSLCMDNKVTIHVFELADGNIARVVAGEKVGTVIETH